MFGGHGAKILRSVSHTMMQLSQASYGASDKKTKQSHIALMLTTLDTKIEGHNTDCCSL